MFAHTGSREEVMKVTIPNGHVEQLILLIRGQKVILDADLA